MTVTVEVKNQLNASIQQEAVEMSAQEETPPYYRLMGCCKDVLPEASVERFLADCRADKEHELEIERRQEEERAARRATLHT
jgi:hypothetical protein